MNFSKIWLRTSFWKHLLGKCTSPELDLDPDLAVKILDPDPAKRSKSDRILDPDPQHCSFHYRLVQPFKQDMLSACLGYPGMLQICLTAS